MKNFDFENMIAFLVVVAVPLITLLSVILMFTVSDKQMAIGCLKGGVTYEKCFGLEQEEKTDAI
jgi:hypothetical protein